MSLDFPNPSRCFEAKKNRIRFWGYDSAIEITFFISVETLLKICPGTGEDEASLLAAFDLALEQVHMVASQVYKRSRTFSYAHLLTNEDF